MSAPTLDGSFPIEGLKGSPSCRASLKGLEVRCGRMPEIENLCRRLLQRLESLHDCVAPLESTDLFKKKYTSVVVRFVKLMRRTPLLLRLANSETIVQKLFGMQQKLDEVQQGVGLGDTPEMTEWSEHWENDRSMQFEKLNQRVSRASARMLVNEIGGGDKKLKETLMTLRSGMTWSGQSPEMMELKKKTDKSVTKYWGAKGLQCFEWFIPLDNVDVEDTIGSGTFGHVSRGVWMRGSKRVNVVVKELFPENNDDSDTGFFKQLQMWRHVPEDKHILTLHGGSHVSTPQFYVCEDVHFGSLDEFLEKHKGMFWRMFHQVAQGLRVLHSQNPPIVHGGLKCTNILVGEDYTAKLTDFGFSSVRSLSASCSGEAASQKAVRWQPKELLEEIGNELPLFASDIYSVGMCMIEVLAHEPPFGMTDDANVVGLITGGVMPGRPDDVSDDTWGLISKLCNPDHTLRPNLEAVLQEFSSRATKEVEEERKLHAVQQGASLNTGAEHAPATKTASARSA